MRLLVLGGTGFAGRAVVEEAVQRGADVTVLNRGLRPALDGVNAVIGDRRSSNGLAALGPDQAWDAVIDTWSAEPSVVRDSARALSGRAEAYLYVSSRSVYRFPMPPGLDESGAVVDSSPDLGAGGAQVPYAEAKRGAELAVEREFAGRAVFARAGLILGPYEDVGRLPWWLQRIARGGVVPAPGPADLTLQYVDVRDLAAWLLGAAQSLVSGPVNLIGPAGSTTMSQLLDACIQVTASSAELRWITPEQIAAAEAEPWLDLPIYLPPGEDHESLHQGDVSLALATGLTPRPLMDTVADTWAWLQSLDGEPPQRADRPRLGLSPEAEARLLNSASAGVRLCKHQDH